MKRPRYIREGRVPRWKRKREKMLERRHVREERRRKVERYRVMRHLLTTHYGPLISERIENDSTFARLRRRVVYGEAIPFTKNRTKA